MLEALQNQTSLLGSLMHIWVPHQQESLPDWGKWKEKHEQSSWALLHHCNTQMQWGCVKNQGRNKGSPCLLFTQEKARLPTCALTSYFASQRSLIYSASPQIIINCHLTLFFILGY